MIGRAADGGIQYLVASGFAGTGGVVVYERTQGGANLTEVARNKDIATRTSFVWASSPDSGTPNYDATAAAAASTTKGNGAGRVLNTAYSAYAAVLFAGIALFL